MLTVQQYCVIACWLVFLIVWIVSAFNTKRYVYRGMRTWVMRIVFIVLAIVIFSSKNVQHYFVGAQTSISTPVVQWLAVLLAVIGIAFAIWARFYLGRNWGMPMSLKQDAQLVTTGPYAYVRHPIYTGMLITMIGSTLVSVWWALAFVFFGVYFIYSAKTEEKIMLKEFPEQYSNYMKRTKMILPFLF